MLPTDLRSSIQEMAMYASSSTQRAKPVIVSSVTMSASFTLMLTPTDTIPDIKDKIQTQTGISPEHLKLKTSDGKTLKSFNISTLLEEEKPELIFDSGLHGGCTGDCCVACCTGCVKCEGKCVLCCCPCFLTEQEREELKSNLDAI